VVAPLVALAETKQTIEIGSLDIQGLDHK